jgi:flagellar basal body P-ring formation protein FlgA
MSKLLRILYICLMGLVASASFAATLRTATTLHSQTVYLRDLFDNAGSNADRPLGQGPGPGARIWLEAKQLRAIARQFGVDWRPISDADRLMLEFPGRPLRREEVVDALRQALVNAGATPDCVIDLPGFNPPLVPLEQAIATDIGQLDYDTVTGRFTAGLTITGEGLTPITMRLAGRVDDVVELPVAVSQMPAGRVLKPEDLHVVRLRTATLHAEAVRTLDQAIGMQLRRQVMAGQPLWLTDITRPTAVARGSSVVMRIVTGGLNVTAPGVALESGATGERIRVENTASRSVVEAEVIGPGQVRVAPTLTEFRRQQP